MKTKVGVVGLGFMGAAHARVYSQLNECELVGVCDIDPKKRFIAERYRCKFFKEFRDLLEEKLDAVSVCTPTSTHKKIATEALGNSHVLVEKPLATNVRDGERLIKNAAETGKLLAVGYLERFNPAVNKLKEAVDFSQFYSTVSLRFGPIPPRTKDVGVLLDLASHEIDVLNYLTTMQPEILYVHVSNRNLGSGFEDYAYLSLKYGHIHSHIEVSWVPSYKLRLINLYGNEKLYSLNYMQQTLKSYRAPPKVNVETGSWNDILWLSRNIEEDMPVTPEEPLKLELKHFVKSIKEGEIVSPLCSGREALEVLKTLKKAGGSRRVDRY